MEYQTFDYSLLRTFCCLNTSIRQGTVSKSKNGEVSSLAKKRIRLLISFITLLVLLGTAVTSPALPDDVVYVVPVTGTIDAGLANFIARAYEEAELSGAKRVLLEINTPGGFIDQAIKIKETIEQAKTPTIAYVTGGAISAGALLALTAPDLVMAPGTTMGAAEPRIGTQKADEKIVSYWASELAGAAEKNGRRADLARAMADADLAIPGLVEKGKLLTLTAKQAKEYGMADDIIPTRAEVLQKYNLGESKVVEFASSPAENFSRWITRPYISSLLLTIGIAGLVIEIFTLGFGVAGVVGLTALALYFGGSILAGLSGWEAVLLFLLGLILLLVEVLVIPGFGLTGAGGLVAIIVSIFLAAPSNDQAVISLVIAIIGTVFLLALSVKFLPTRKVWNRLVLGTRQEKTTGYVAPRKSLADLEGKVGVTITPLRPAGAAEIGGERVDVVTDGAFIPPQTPIKVIKVEGTRVVVSKHE